MKSKQITISCIHAYMPTPKDFRVVISNSNDTAEMFTSHESILQLLDALDYPLKSFLAVITQQPFDHARPVTTGVSFGFCFDQFSGTYTFPNRQAPILSSSSLLFTSATSITRSGTLASRATFNP